MAEFILKDLTKRFNLESSFKIESAATSQEEIGNGVYPPVRSLLSSMGIDSSAKRARQVSGSDIREFDYLIAMEEFNLENLYYLHKDIDKDKVFLLLDFTGKPRDIDDPWYTRDFQTAKNQITLGCIAFLLSLNREGKLAFDSDTSDKLLKLYEEYKNS